VELQAFTPDDAAAAIDAWRLPPAAAAQLQDRLHDPATGAMARIPLLLALMCSLAAQAPGREALPRTRGQLYERVLQWFLTGAHRSLDDPRAPARDNVEVEALLQILAPLAFAFATQPAGWTDLMPTDNLLNAIRAAGPAFTELNRPAKDVLRDLSVGAGVLVPDGDPSAGRSPRYLFLHRTVAEYLTARHLATLPEADWLAIVELHRWFDPDWAEVIPMLGERLSPDGARALIQHLLASQSDPFHYALLTAARVWGARPDADHLLAPRHADELVRLLDDLLQHELTSTAASLACAGMTYLPRPILTRLLAHLTDQERFVRQASVEALAGRQESAVTKALLGRLTDQDKTVRQAAVEALAGHQDPTVTEALLARLTDGNQSVRRAAVAPLAGRQDPRVTDALLARLTDQDKTVRRAAVEALGGCQDRGVTEALVGRLTDDDSTVRRGAVKALAHRLDPGVTEALVGRLTDRDISVRDAAWKAVAGRRDPGVTKPLLDRLNDHDMTVRRAAVAALAGRQDRGVTRALVGRLTDGDWTVRRAAVAALAGRQDPIVTEALLRSLHDKDEALRLEAVAAVADRQDRGVIEALLRLLTDKDKTLQRAAVAALAGRQDPAVIEALLGRLTNQDLPLRREAMEALGRETPETLLILARKVRTLSQPSLLVVTEAAEALMIRHYRRIDPADQPEVLASMGWLTTAALSDGSA
jgi:HEAT repeat protein